jgi:hypothetical protein
MHRYAWLVLALISASMFWSRPGLTQSHAGHRMGHSASGMVMNENSDRLPDDCTSITRDYEFEVSAGTDFAAQWPGVIFAYNVNAFEVEPCSRVTVTLKNLDEVRHQWMLHGLPRYLYPGGMFHLEAAGGHSVTGVFIVPSDHRMEKGMKGQMTVGSGSGDLWAIPGVSGDLLRAAYLPADWWFWPLLLLLGIPAVTLAVGWSKSRD